ncbi:MAG: threonylcarbamoyl-AMP synthase [Muribaculaceae bacterium]|nr:threonylcarbamoyl-AMP synthase [Muribaculaceae bacterium]
MKILKIYSDTPDARHIAEAARTIADGGVVIFPTDTIYALGCDALNHRAIERMCRIKGIDPAGQHLSLLCADLSQASDYVRIDNGAFRTLRHCLPGPFTFLLPAALRLPKVFRNRKTIGLRVPDNAIARALAEAAGPLLCTSVILDDPEELHEPESIAMRYASQAELLLDGGHGGSEGSAIIDLTDSSAPQVLREGPIAFEE